MQRNDVFFTLAVAVFALVFVGITVSHSGKAMLQGPEAGSGRGGAAGQSRTVDLERIRALIERDRLSDREALHYRKAAENEVGSDETP